MGNCSHSQDSAHGPSGIDREHDIIVKAMAGLHNAVLDGRGAEVIVPLINLLAQFCAEHFANEEGVMRDCGYEGADAHAAAHEALLRRIIELQARSKDDTLPTIVDTMELLGRLSLHTDRFDREAECSIRETAKRRKARVTAGPEPNMALMVWKEQYRLGIVAIDVQHRALLDLTNKLHKAAMRAEDAADIDSAMEDLLNYATFHFTFEERMMENCGYPFFEEHRKTHSELLDQLKGLLAYVADGQMELNERVMNFLQGWLTHHIVSSDRYYVPFVKANKRVADGSALVTARDT